MELEIRGLKVKLGSVEVLKGMAFSLGRGEILGILGPNGSGKSTLLRAIYGVLRPLDGIILVDGQDIRNLSLKEIARMIGYLPQESFESGLLVEDIVMLGRTPHLGGLSPDSKDFDAVERALSSIGMLNYRKRKFSELSGGEKQKTLLARVFAQESSILLLDEPTSHLDISSQLEIMELIKEKVSRGSSAIIAIHDINLASAYCDRLLLVRDGIIFSAGTPDEVITPENIRKVFGAEVEVKRIGGKLYVIPAFRRTSGKNRRVHVICGGGSGSDLIRRLWESGYRVSAGVLNVLDSDWMTITDLKGEVVSENPFSEIGEESHRKNLELIEKADIVVLTSLSVGKGNLKNLEAALHAARLGKLYVIEEKEFEKRNFAGEDADRIYSEIKAAVPDSRVFSTTLSINLLNNTDCKRSTQY